ncbi:MAG: hypothetical protein ACN23H_01205 [Candidatus Phytoplasma vitis]|nr:MAG: hypothetical protein M6G77_01080 [Candidatus Phytoplasma vitis]
MKNNKSEKNKYDLYESLMKKTTVIKLINKSSLHAPRFIDVEDLKQEAYLILDKFITNGLVNPEQRQINLFMIKLKRSLYDTLRGYYGIKYKGAKNSADQYPNILNYTTEDQLENPIV